MGGRWPGYPDGSTEFPQRLVVDYVRVFELGTDEPIGSVPNDNGTASDEASTRFAQLTESVMSVRANSGVVPGTSIGEPEQAVASEDVADKDGSKKSSMRSDGSEARIDRAAAVSIPAVTPSALALGLLALLGLSRRHL